MLCLRRPGTFLNRGSARICQICQSPHQSLAPDADPAADGSAPPPYSRHPGEHDATLSHPEWQIPFSELRNVTYLGARGAFKLAHSATWRTKEVAVLEGVHGAQIRLEADTMARLGRHPSLVTFYGLSRSPQGSSVLVCELARHGSLDSLLLRHRGEVSLQVKLAMAGQICQGMVAMHTEGIIHRDLAAR